jgi:hypothetical protein
MRPVKKNIITIIEVHPGTVICKIKCSITDFTRYIRLTAQKSKDIQVITRIGAAEKLSIASMDKPAILKNIMFSRSNSVLIIYPNPDSLFYRMITFE